MINLIVCVDSNNGIGKDNKLLCHLPNDLKHFKKLTTGNCVAMGRKTYDSIGKPLPNRTNLILYYCMYITNIIYCEGACHV